MEINIKKAKEVWAEMANQWYYAHNSGIDTIDYLQDLGWGDYLPAFILSSNVEEFINKAFYILLTDEE